MEQEELKTCLGQLLSDLRSDWSYMYYDRLKTALNLCNNIQDNTIDIECKIDEEINDFYGCDGRTFRSLKMYNYSSKEGITERVKEWLNNNLNHPEYCDVLINN